MNQKTIILLSALHEPVSIIGYGGIERIVYESARLLPNHDYNVHVFGAGEPVDLPGVTFHQVRELPLRAEFPDDNRTREFEAIVAANEAWGMIRKLNPDLVINHAGVSALWGACGNLPPTVTVLHNNLSEAIHRNSHLKFKDAPVVSISKSQRKPLPELNYVGNVYNGIPVYDFTFVPDKGEYLAWIGRITPEKGPDLAIDIAVKAKKPLRMAGIVDQNNKEFFEKEIIPRLRRHKNLVTFLGEIDHEQKNELLKGALALLVPNRWAEPFGLMMVEAMACGTPVMATRLGSVPEIITPDVGINISYTDNNDNLVAYFVWQIPNIQKIDRRTCRTHVEKKFSSDIMTQGYANLCKKMTGSVRARENIRTIHG